MDDKNFDIIPEFKASTIRERKLMQIIENQNKIICTLKQELTTAEQQCRGFEEDKRRSKMFRILERYAGEGVDPNTIGCNVSAFSDLLKEEETE